LTVYSTFEENGTEWLIAPDLPLIELQQQKDHLFIYNKELLAQLTFVHSVFGQRPGLFFCDWTVSFSHWWTMIGILENMLARAYLCVCLDSVQVPQVSVCTCFVKQSFDANHV
jgi:hypothetical protein